MSKYELEIYTTDKGEIPFQDWLERLKDNKAQAKIAARLRRASFGNFGDYKIIKGAKNIFEMREHYGSGYRIFYSIINNKIILLLAGSTKKKQNETIIKAIEYFTDYQRRKE
ncbi:type II toxin-antitoxin system RelE/ParE family toxin [Geminocystis sp. CENA526]|uniref:type II toxin-antitoxin system RelE/ParE family toxin n=1 Tax=Geminocystis sp. CENA526 TaxID=1355871 RepID=UPI003D6FDC56